MENESTRQSAVEAILERNPNAFRPKIQAGATVSSHTCCCCHLSSALVCFSQLSNASLLPALSVLCQCSVFGVLCLMARVVSVSEASVYSCKASLS